MTKWLTKRVYWAIVILTVVNVIGLSEPMSIGAAVLGSVIGTAFIVFGL